MSISFKCEKQKDIISHDLRSAIKFQSKPVKRFPWSTIFCGGNPKRGGWGEMVNVITAETCKPNYFIFGMHYICYKQNGLVLPLTLR